MFREDVDTAEVGPLCVKVVADNKLKTIPKIVLVDHLC